MHSYVSTGHLVYAQRAALIAVPFDLDRLEASGPAVQLIDGVAAIQREGRRALRAVGHRHARLRTASSSGAADAAWVDRDGGTTALPLEPRPYWTPRFSPDGRQFAVVVREDQTSHIWVQRFDNEHVQPCDTTGTELGARVVARRIAAALRVPAKRAVAPGASSRLTEAHRQKMLLTSETHEVVPGTLTRDGRSLIYVQRSPDGDAALRVLDLSSRQTQALDDLPARVGMPARSPDGRWLGFTAWTPIRPSVFVRPLESQGPARQLVEAAGYTVWSRTGDRLSLPQPPRFDGRFAGDGIFELPFDPIRGVATGPERQLFRKSFTDWLGVPGFDVAADGRFLLALSDARGPPASRPERRSARRR